MEVVVVVVGYQAMGGSSLVLVYYPRGIDHDILSPRTGDACIC